MRWWAIKRTKIACAKTLSTSHATYYFIMPKISPYSPILSFFFTILTQVVLYKHMTENRMTIYVLFCARYYVVVCHVTYISGLSNRVTSAFDFIIAYTYMYVNVKQKFMLVLLYTTFQLLHHLPRAVVCIDIGPDLGSNIDRGQPQQTT